MMFACPLFYAVVLLYIVESHGGEGHGKEPQPKLPPMPKTKEKKPEKEVKESFSACYEGYTLTDKKCIKKISEPPLHIGNAVTVPYFQRCPPGFDDDKKSSRCSMSVEVPPEYFCPSGWIDNVNNCIIKESPVYNQECPKGKKWELIDNRCVFFHKAKQVITSECPGGAHVEEDGHCWKVIGTYDCTPEKKEKKKKDKKQEETKKDHKKEKLRQLGEGHSDEEHKKKERQKEEHKKGKKPEVLKEMEPVSAPMTTKVGVASQLCEKKVMVEPLVLVSCPEGFVEVENEECLKEEVTAPISVCGLTKKKGDAECGGKQRETEKVAKCPAGAEKVKDKCIQTTVVSPLNVCASGWKDTGTGCLGQLEKVPDVECRPGLTLVDDQCVGQLVRHPVHVSLKIPEPCESKGY